MRCWLPVWGSVLQPVWPLVLQNTFLCSSLDIDDASYIDWTSSVFHTDMHLSRMNGIISEC